MSARRLLLGVGGSLDYDGYLGRFGPVAWWKMQEASGNIADSGSNGDPGSPNGTPDYQQTGPSSAIPYAINFNGTDEWFSIADSPDFENTDAFTFLAWIKPSATGRAIWGKLEAPSGYRGIELLVHSGTNTFALQIISVNSSGNAIYVRGSTAIAVDGSTWYFVAATYDGSASAAGVSLYVNGSAETTTAITDGLTTTILNNVTAEIGRSGSASGVAHWSGLLAQQAIFDKMLTAAQISEFYTRGIA